MEVPQSHHVIIDLLHSTLGFGEPDFGMTHSSMELKHVQVKRVSNAELVSESNMTNCILDALMCCMFANTITS